MGAGRARVRGQRRLCRPDAARTRLAEAERQKAAAPPSQTGPQPRTTKRDQRRLSTRCAKLGRARPSRGRASAATAHRHCVWLGQQECAAQAAPFCLSESVMLMLQGFVVVLSGYVGFSQLVVKEHRSNEPCSEALSAAV